MYNLTLLSNSSGILGLAQQVNTNLISGWLGTFWLIGLSAVIFISTMYTTNDAHKAFATTGFISFALSLALVGLGLLPNLALFITLIIAAISVATMWGSY